MNRHALQIAVSKRICAALFSILQNHSKTTEMPDITHDMAA